MQNMTIADLVRKCSDELDREIGPAILITCYECGCSFSVREPTDQITDSEVCGFDGCPSYDLWDEY